MKKRSREDQNLPVDHSANRRLIDPLFTVRLDKPDFDVISDLISQRMNSTGQTKKQIVTAIFMHAMLAHSLKKTVIRASIKGRFVDVWEGKLSL